MVQMQCYGSQVRIHGQTDRSTDYYKTAGLGLINNNNHFESTN